MNMGARRILRLRKQGAMRAREADETNAYDYRCVRWDDTEHMFSSRRQKARGYSASEIADPLPLGFPTDRAVGKA